jgi:hypothetical protein
MNRTCSIAFVACVMFSATVFAQTVKPPDTYDPSGEIKIKGTIVALISTRGADDVVGVHMDVKTDKGVVRVQVGPALFIGENNFWFQCDDEVEIVGAMVARAGSAALWTRSIAKNDGKVLALRDERGAPLWKIDGQADPDGCGITHPVVR